MPCATPRKNQTLEQRSNEVQAALKRLERSLQNGAVRVTIGANGAVAFVGWNDRDDVADVCAYRTLAAENSWALRQAVARAEQLSGRKVNPRAVAAGLHSHDNGRTWSKH
jgi:hypothetical protein